MAKRASNPTAIKPVSAGGAPAATHAPRKPGTRRPDVESVQRRAYEIFQARTALGQPGDATTDWLRAERELSER